MPHPHFPRRRGGPEPTSGRSSGLTPDWTLTTVLHDAFRRDLDEMIGSDASRAAIQARWALFRDQLRFHHAAEDRLLWPRAREMLAGDPSGLTVLEAMEEEHRLVVPLLSAIDDALETNASRSRVQTMLTMLRAMLTSHLAHEEADALRLIGAIMPEPELAAIVLAMARTGGARNAAVMFPWALSTARAEARSEVLSRLPTRIRLLYRTVWLPQYLRETPPL